jgi:hypothetical protein
MPSNITLAGSGVVTDPPLFPPLPLGPLPLGGGVGAVGTSIGVVLPPPGVVVVVCEPGPSPTTHQPLPGTDTLV